METKFELYVHYKQSNGDGITGFNMEVHLEKMGLMNRTLSLENELVKSWIANPTSYPEEFKGIVPLGKT